MNSNLIIHSNEGLSYEQWLAKRINGLGASDIGTLFGFNQYKAPIELFYEKIDPTPRPNVDNIHSFMGRYMEDDIANLWQYFDKTQESIIENYKAKRIVRKCRRINASVSNPAYPNLYVSLDRVINKHDGRGEGALELKTISTYEANKWESGIPHSHMMQVQCQIMVCDFTYGELAILKDGKFFELWPFEKNENICNAIAEKVREFWAKVERGRVLMTRKYEAVSSYNFNLANECEAEIQELEPSPDGSDAYTAFMREKFKNRPIDANTGVIQGTESDLAAAREYTRINEAMKALKTAQVLEKNKLLRRLESNRKISFQEGYVSNIDNRFSVKIK